MSGTLSLGWKRSEDPPCDPSEGLLSLRTECIFQDRELIDAMARHQGCSEFCSRQAILVALISDSNE